VAREEVAHRQLFFVLVIPALALIFLEAAVEVE
jgi:hypothetical protein